MLTQFSDHDLSLMAVPRQKVFPFVIRRATNMRILLKASPPVKYSSAVSIEIVLVTDKGLQHRIRFEPYDMAQRDAVDTQISMRGFLCRTDVTTKEQLTQLLSKTLANVCSLHVRIDGPADGNLQFSLRFGEHYANTRFVPSREMKPFFSLVYPT